MPASTLPAYRDALATALRSRPGLADVEVFAYMAIANLPENAWIEMTRATVTEEYLAMGTKMETYRIEVTCWDLNNEGGSDVEAHASEVAALGYADEIRAVIELDPTLGDVVTHSEWVGGQVDTEQNENGRWTKYEGEVMIENYLQQ